MTDQKQTIQEEQNSQGNPYYVEDLLLISQHYERALADLKQKYGDKERNITVSFSMTVFELAILHAHAAGNGNASISASLRSIIASWYFNRAGMVTSFLNDSTTPPQTGI